MASDNSDSHFRAANLPANDAFLQFQPSSQTSICLADTPTCPGPLQSFCCSCLVSYRDGFTLPEVYPKQPLHLCPQATILCVQRFDLAVNRLLYKFNDLEIWKENSDYYALYDAGSHQVVMRRDKISEEEANLALGSENGATQMLFALQARLIKSGMNGVSEWGQ